MKNKTGILAMSATAAPTRERRRVTGGEHGVDFDELNRGAAKYRKIAQEDGFDAALSHHAGTPTKTVKQRDQS